MLFTKLLARHDNLVFMLSGDLRLCLGKHDAMQCHVSMEILEQLHKCCMSQILCGGFASQSCCMDACCSSIRSKLLLLADLDWEQGHINDDISKCQTVSDHVRVAAKR